MIEVIKKEGIQISGAKAYQAERVALYKDPEACLTQLNYSKEFSMAETRQTNNQKRDGRAESHAH